MAKTTASAPAEREMSGDLSAVRIAEVCQTLCLSQRHGILILSPAKGREARLFFLSGKIVRAEYENLPGDEAAIRILGLREGRFLFRSEAFPLTPNVTRATEMLLLAAVSNAQAGTPQRTRPKPDFEF